MQLNGGCLRFWAKPIRLHSDLQANMWLDRLNQTGRFASLRIRLFSLSLSSTDLLLSLSLSLCSFLLSSTRAISLFFLSFSRFLLPLFCCPSHPSLLGLLLLSSLFLSFFILSFPFFSFLSPRYSLHRTPAMYSLWEGSKCSESAHISTGTTRVSRDGEDSRLCRRFWLRDRDFRCTALEETDATGCSGDKRRGDPHVAQLSRLMEIGVHVECHVENEIEKSDDRPPRSSSLGMIFLIASLRPWL